MQVSELDDSASQLKKFQKELSSGTVSLVLLAVLRQSRQPMYGYQIAKRLEEVGEGVEVLARVEDGPAAGRIVAVRQGSLMATSFHPEVTGDHRFHQLFVEIVRGNA